LLYCLLIRPFDAALQSPIDAPGCFLCHTVSAMKYVFFGTFLKNFMPKWRFISTQNTKSGHASIAYRNQLSPK